MAGHYGVKVGVRAGVIFYGVSFFKVYNSDQGQGQGRGYGLGHKAVGIYIGGRVVGYELQFLQ